MIRLFRVSIPAGVLVLLLSEVVLTSLCFGVAAFLVLRRYDYDLITYFLYDGGLIRMTLVLTSIILGLHFSDLYTRIHVKSRTRLLQELSQVIGVALLAQGLIAYATPALKLGRGIMLVGTIVSFLALFFWRLFYDGFLLEAVAGDRILFVGFNQVIQEIAEHISTHRELGLSVVGYLVNEGTRGSERNGAKVRGSVADLSKIATEMKPSRIVVGMTERRD